MQIARMIHCEYRRLRRNGLPRDIALHNAIQSVHRILERKRKEQGK